MVCAWRASLPSPRPESLTSLLLLQVDRRCDPAPQPQAIVSLGELVDKHEITKAPEDHVERDMVLRAEGNTGGFQQPDVLPKGVPQLLWMTCVKGKPKSS